MLKFNPINTAHWQGDMFGGVTAAIIALPLALAFGVASGAGPVAGLYGAICVGLFAALFGGTPAQISGPTGPMTIVAASVFTQFGDSPATAFTVVMMAGGFQILFGYLRVGRYVNLMPYPVVSGFMTGIGCILIVLQLEPLLGHPAPTNVMNALTVLPTDFFTPNGNATLVGLGALAICFWTPRRIATKVPPPLIALVLCSVLSAFLEGVPVLGAVPTGLPNLQVPNIDFAQLNYMLVSAAVLAALGSIDSLLTSLVADNMSRSFHDSDKELIGQGIGNFLAGMVGGLPGAGATIRTLANLKAGGRTPLSGAVHAAVLFVVALGFGPVVAWIPKPALAGILLKVGIDVIDWRFLKRMHRAPRTDLVLMLVVLVLTVFVDVITAVGIGVVLASLAFVKEMAAVQVQAIQTIVDEEHHGLLDQREAEAFRRCEGQTAILHLSGPMSFGAANEMMRRIVAVKEVSILLIDLSDVPSIDGSAALTLEEIIQRATHTGQHVLMAGMQYSVARLLGRLGVLDEIRETTRFATRTEALDAAVILVRQEDSASHN